MSDLTELIVSQIIPSAKQLLQLELVKRINTGDRIKDGLVIALIFAIINFALHMFTKYIDFFGKYCKATFTTETQLIKEAVIAIRKNRCYITDLLRRVPIKRTSFVLDKICAYIALKKSVIDGGDVYNPRTAVLYVYFNEKYQEQYVIYHDYYIYCSPNYDLKNSPFANWVINNLNDNKQFIKCLTKETKDKDQIIGDVPLNCTFENIYFDKKNVLLDWIHKFKTNNIYPPNLPISNKLGILLYGPPGTGKTGCIRALANELKRNLVIVNDITKESILEKALNNTTDIVVFDEFDYLLTSENNCDDKVIEEMRERMIVAPQEEKDNIMQEIIKLKSEKKTTVQRVLQLLDGVADTTGRIIIATTNNIHKINPLFLRPGRFDVKIELGYCSLEMFRNIVTTKFAPKEFDVYQADFEQLHNITPLELINKLVESNTVCELLDKFTL